MSITQTEATMKMLREIFRKISDFVFWVLVAFALAVFLYRLSEIVTDGIVYLLLHFLSQQP